jgi:hypothetical protein
MVKCQECGRIVNLVSAVSLAVEEEGEFKGVYFCSQQHLDRYTAKSSFSVNESGSE